MSPMYEIRFSMMAEAVDENGARRRAEDYLADGGGEKIAGFVSTAQVSEIDQGWYAKT